MIDEEYESPIETTIFFPVESAADTCLGFKHTIPENVTSTANKHNKILFFIISFLSVLYFYKNSFTLKA